MKMQLCFSDSMVRISASTQAVVYGPDTGAYYTT